MSFESDLQRFTQRSTARADTVIKRIVLGIAGEVIRKSPVDTGRFKGNWQYGAGNAPTGDVEIYDEDGRGTVAHIASQIPTHPAGEVHYIVNNLPYAKALEDGHSTQSPPGNMVAGTVAEYQRIVSEAAREPD